MKLSLEEILVLIEKVNEAKLDSFSYRDEDIQIKIRGARPVETQDIVNGKPEREWAAFAPEFDSEPAPEAKGAAKKSRPELPEGSGVQASPMVGIFYASDTEGGEPLVRPGDKVKKGQVIGIIEAMKLMNEIRSEYDGTVEQVLAENGQLVEFGQPLFRITAALDAE